MCELDPVKRPTAEWLLNKYGRGSTFSPHVTLCSANFDWLQRQVADDHSWISSRWGEVLDLQGTPKCFCVPSNLSYAKPVQLVISLRHLSKHCEMLECRSLYNILEQRSPDAILQARPDNTLVLPEAVFTVMAEFGIEAQSQEELETMHDWILNAHLAQTDANNKSNTFSPASSDFS